jgi:nitrous oxidase accessory protein NosD
MAYTLRGRLESRLAFGLLPLLAASGLSLALRAWWPLVLVSFMVGAGLTLDVLLYHRLLPYQAGWLAAPLGALELAATMALALAAGVEVPLGHALALFGGAWLLAQVLGHAALPLLRHSYGEDGGELGRAGPVVAGAVLVLFASAGGTAWATQPPTVRLAAGVHPGPVVLDHSQKLVGQTGAVVRGGIVVTSDDVTIRNVTVVAGDHGIEIDGAQNVLLDGVRVVGATLDGINVRRSSVTIRDCRIEAPAGPYAQGIDISFGFDLEPSVVENCTVAGGREGIVTHFAHVIVRENRVTGTSLRAITLTEMSMANVAENDVEGALGVGIYCGDFSMCEIEDNLVSGTRPDPASGDRTRMGYGIVAHSGASATIAGNRLQGNASPTASFLRARIYTE